MSWPHLNWSPAEKKIARAAYDAALDAALTLVMAEFKRRAEVAAEPADMWETERYLLEARREIDATFTYSYSKLPNVFGYAIHKGYIAEDRLAGLSDDKLAAIDRMRAWFRSQGPISKGAPQIP